MLSSVVFFGGRLGDVVLNSCWGWTVFFDDEWLIADRGRSDGTVGKLDTECFYENWTATLAGVVDCGWDGCGVGIVGNILDPKSTSISDHDGSTFGGGCVVFRLGIVCQPAALA